MRKHSKNGLLMSGRKLSRLAKLWKQASSASA